MNKPIYFGALTFFVALLSSLSLIILVNIMIRNNVYSEAEATLRDLSVTQSLVNNTNDSTIEEYPIFFDVVSNEQTNMLIRFIDKTLSPSDLLYEHEVALLNYVKSNEFELNQVHIAKLNSNNIYFSIINDNYVFYINTDEYLYILDTLNKFFLIATIILLLISVLSGYKAGRFFENTEAQLKRFFSNASHELKTPLTSIQGYTESIYFDITPDVKGSCKVVLNQCELMERLIEELLLLSKLDSNALKLDSATINIYEVIDRLISYIKPIFNEQNIQLICDFDGYEGITFCDEKYMYHVFNTILSNSLRYAASKVEISTKISNTNIIITISDDGEGFSDEDLPHIFKRFYVGKNGVSGIGLSLAKEIIKLHKGTISARNNNGAELTIIMPKSH